MGRLLPRSLVLVVALAVVAASCAGGDDADEPAGASTTGADAERTGELTLLSYNVAGLPEVLSGSEPETNMPLIGPLLNDYDLVLLQETWKTPDPNPLAPLRVYHEELESRVDFEHRSESAPLPMGSDPTRPEAILADGLNQFSRFPFDDVVRAARATHGGTLGKVGVVGLGAGSLACHRHAGETWRFYEIDPIVVDIARNPANFRFLSDCAPDAAIVVGDARLTLAREAKDTFDLLVIDAFSSDAIPVHLMTGEAMSLYVDRLAPGGMLMMHISNRNLELASVVEANARASGLVAVERIGSATDADVDDDLAAKAHVIAMARTRQDLGILATDKDWHPVDAMPGVKFWTDDYSNIIGAIVRSATRPATTGIE